jgi:putative DNA primase/helicase
VTATPSPFFTSNGPPGPLVPLTVDAIPRELRDLPQWVTWRLIHKPGAPKPTKLPVSPSTGEAASTTDPTTWSTFNEALAAFHSGGANGIGFVFSPDDTYVGIDLDECYDPEAGSLLPPAEIIIPSLSTYTELSPSGRGLHLILRGKLPGPRRRQGRVEMYSEGRFFTMTGFRLDGTPPDIAERTVELQEVYHRVFDGINSSVKCGASDVENLSSAPPIPSDDDLVRRALLARNGEAFARLWRGDWQGYPSQSEADLALCAHLAFWTANDDTRMDRIFRRSGLFRPKWDELHGAQTYGQMTISKALSSTSPVPRVPASQDSVPSVDFNSFPVTDAGNAELFANLYGNQLRYDHSRGHWLLWEGHRWASDTDGEVYRLAKDAARARYLAAVGIGDLELRKKVSEFAVRSESRQKLEACLALAQNEHPIADSGMNWDTDSYLLGVANGVLDLRTGNLRPGRPEDRLTMRVPVDYDPTAESPRWDQFLHQVFQCDWELIGFVQRAVGYSLTGSVREQVLFLCNGSGANGKSVFLATLRHLAGDYALNIPFTVLELQQRPSLTNDLAAMVGKRLVTSSETNESTRLNEARIKALTGGDPITARFLYSESFTFDPVAKFWLAVNHLPLVRDDTYGFWRRVLVLPFRQRFSGRDADPDLAHKLHAELSGILAWAIQGALNWRVVGLAPPDAVKVATEAYLEENDELAPFIADRCVVSENIRIEPGQIFSEYQHWAESQGIPLQQRLKLRTFATRMKERFSATSTNGKRYYLGVGLKVHSDG